MLEFEDCNGNLNSNSSILDAYDEDGVIGFLGFLMRNKGFLIEYNTIKIPGIESPEDVRNALKEYELDTKKFVLNAQEKVLKEASTIGIFEYLNKVAEERKSLEIMENQKENDYEEEI